VSGRPRPVSVREVLELMRELREGRERPLLLLGPQEVTAVLRRALTQEGVEGAVRLEGPVEEAAAVVSVLVGRPGQEELEALRRAERSRIPAVAVLVESPGERLPDPPSVLAEHVVRAKRGAPLPLEAVARALARALGERATPLAAQLPVLREAVVDELIRRAARRNALIGATLVLPGADLPVLTLTQVRLLLRIADAYGFELDRERIPEVLAVVAGALGWRSAARSALGLLPLAGWLVKGGVAYAGTRAVGEAARRYFSARAPVRRTPGARAPFPR
jgi:uncharacterized protein (DUF697 family)